MYLGDSQRSCSYLILGRPVGIFMFGIAELWGQGVLCVESTEDPVHGVMFCSTNPPNPAATLLQQLGMSPGLAICPFRDKIIPGSKPLTSKSRCSLNTTATVLFGPHTWWSNADTDAVFRCQRVKDRTRALAAGGTFQPFV